MRRRCFAARIHGETLTSSFAAIDAHGPFEVDHMAAWLDEPLDMSRNQATKYHWNIHLTGIDCTA
jgi:hypothetical protein